MLHPESEIKGFQFRKTGTRYFVPDLSPHDQVRLAGLKPRWVFVAESPHVNEVEPDQLEARRPLCGAAGRQWWSMLSEILEGEANSDVSLDRLIQFCLNHRIAVLNAVQFPLDPKIMVRFPAADPVKLVGFNKVTGPYSYKKLKNEHSVRSALIHLQSRLTDRSLENSQIHCLGNDAEWFVTEALKGTESSAKIGQKIPHPSAWWRQGGFFGRTARERLGHIFK